MSWIASLTQMSKRSAAKEAAGLSTGSEQRIKKRYPTRRRIACQPMHHDAASWTGQVIDLSETGLCLELGRRFERGVLLTVVLENEHAEPSEEGEETEQSEPRSTVVRVMWVRQQSPGVWRMGCQFDQPLCESEVQDLV